MRVPWWAVSRLMRIRADQSAVGAINRPLHTLYVLRILLSLQLLQRFLAHLFPVDAHALDTPTAMPSPSRTIPKRICSVPMVECPRLLASSMARVITFLARGVSPISPSTMRSPRPIINSTAPRALCKSMPRRCNICAAIVYLHVRGQVTGVLCRYNCVAGVVPPPGQMPTLADYRL